LPQFQQSAVANALWSLWVRNIKMPHLKVEINLQKKYKSLVTVAFSFNINLFWIFSILLLSVSSYPILSSLLDCYAKTKFLSRRKTFPNSSRSRRKLTKASSNVGKCSFYRVSCLIIVLLFLRFIYSK
jgi:hypothetical protein